MPRAFGISARVFPRTLFDAALDDFAAMPYCAGSLQGLAHARSDRLLSRHVASFRRPEPSSAPSQRNDLAITSHVPRLARGCVRVDSAVRRSAPAPINASGSGVSRNGRSSMGFAPRAAKRHARSIRSIPNTGSRLPPGRSCRSGSPIGLGRLSPGGSDEGHPVPRPSHPFPPPGRQIRSSPAQAIARSRASSCLFRRLRGRRLAPSSLSARRWSTARRSPVESAASQGVPGPGPARRQAVSLTLFYIPKLRAFGDASRRGDIGTSSPSRANAHSFPAICASLDGLRDVVRQVRPIMP